MKKFLFSLFVVLAVFSFSACDNDINKDKPSFPIEEIPAKPIPNKGDIEKEFFEKILIINELDPMNASLGKSYEKTEYIDSSGKSLYSKIIEDSYTDWENTNRREKRIILSDTLETLKKGDVIVKEKREDSSSVYILNGQNELTIEQEKEFFSLFGKSTSNIRNDSFYVEFNNHVIGDTAYKISWLESYKVLENEEETNKSNYTEILFEPGYMGVSSFKL